MINEFGEDIEFYNTTTSNHPSINTHEREIRNLLEVYNRDNVHSHFVKFIGFIGKWSGNTTKFIYDCDGEILERGIAAFKSSFKRDIEKIDLSVIKKISVERIVFRVSREISKLKLPLRIEGVMSDQGAHTLLRLVCLKHSTQYDTTTYHSFYNKHSHGGCPVCISESYKEKNKLSDDVWKQRLADRLRNSNIMLREPYLHENSKGRLKTKCLVDGYEWEPLWDEFVNNNTGCPCCNVGNVTYEMKVNKIDYLLSFEDNIKLLEPMLDVGSVENSLHLLCNCGNEWWCTFNNFTRGTRCGKCTGKESRKMVDIDYIISPSEYEKRFVDCRWERPLPFDRYYENRNMLLEYDGEQHFRITSGWHSSPEHYSECVQRDSLKTEYAITNGYNFLRIAFYEDHVSVLKSFLELIKENPGKQIVQIYGDVRILDKK